MKRLEFRQGFLSDKDNVATFIEWDYDPDASSYHTPDMFIIGNATEHPELLPPDFDEILYVVVMKYRPPGTVLSKSITDLEPHELQRYRKEAGRIRWELALRPFLDGNPHLRTYATPEFLSGPYEFYQDEIATKAKVREIIALEPAQVMHLRERGIDMYFIPRDD